MQRPNQSSDRFDFRVLQGKGLTDRQAADAVASRIDWKYVGLRSSYHLLSIYGLLTIIIRWLKALRAKDTVGLILPRTPTVKPSPYFPESE